MQVSTLIGYGSPNKADSHDVHGAPLGANETAATREHLDWKYGEFDVPSEVRAHFSSIVEKGKKAEAAWNDTLAEYTNKYPGGLCQPLSVVCAGLCQMPSDPLQTAGVIVWARCVADSMMVAAVPVFSNTGIVDGFMPTEHSHAPATLQLD